MNDILRDEPNDLHTLSLVQEVVKILPSFLNQSLSLYVVATGAGAAIQDWIWEIPGCSSFFRGASFPYHPSESAEFAGVVPEKYASDEFAIDLAAAAYTRAIVDDPKVKPVGLAITASVAGLKEHRGDHRLHIVCMTPDRVLGRTLTIPKGVGTDARKRDGLLSDMEALRVFIAAMDPTHPFNMACKDVSDKARARFFEHPVQLPTGAWVPKSYLDEHMPKNALFAGAFNPPHDGHLGICDRVEEDYHSPIYTICVNPPHKEAISVQEMLRRAKLLRKHSSTAVTLFTENDPFYIDKARANPGRPLVIGADALLRMFDPKWGPQPRALYEEFQALKTLFLVFGRVIDGEYVAAGDAITKVWDLLGFMETREGMRCVPLDYKTRAIFTAIGGRWDISSTALRQDPPAPSPAPSPATATDPTHSDASPVPAPAS